MLFRREEEVGADETATAQRTAIRIATKPFGFRTINTPYLDGIRSTECRGANFK